MNKPGVLDTSTLILLGRITAVDALPEAAFIIAVTRTEVSVDRWSPRPTKTVFYAKFIFRLPKQTSIRFFSMLSRRERSAAWQHR